MPSGVYHKFRYIPSKEAVAIHLSNQLIDTEVVALTFLFALFMWAWAQKRALLHGVSVAKVYDRNMASIVDLKPEPFFVFPSLFLQQQMWRV